MRMSDGKALSGITVHLIYFCFDNKADGLMNLSDHPDEYCLHGDVRFLGVFAFIRGVREET